MKRRRKLRRAGTVDWVALLPMVIGVCVGSALAHSGTSTMPFQVGALMDGSGTSASQTGFFAFAEVGALAGSMVVISPFMARFSPRAVGLAGCLLAAVGNAGIFFGGHFAVQVALAVVAGAGYGFAYAATIAAAAAAAEPHRLYAAGNMGALFIIMGLMNSLPVVSAKFGSLGVFASLAVLSLGCAPFFFCFRRQGRSEETRLSAIKVKGAPGLLFAWASMSAGVGGVYAFSERIGQHLHLGRPDIAGVLSAGTFVGLLGTGVAAVFGRRLNRRFALIAGLGGAGAACLLLGFASNLATFALGVFAYWVFTMFLYSYLLGAAAMLDASGQVGTLGGGLERLGYGLGAALGGVVAERFSYSATGVLGFVGCILGLAIGIPSVLRALNEKSETADTAAATTPAGAGVVQIGPP